MNYSRVQWLVPLVAILPSLPFTLLLATINNERLVLRLIRHSDGAVAENSLFHWAGNAGQKFEIRIGGLENNTVTAGTGSHEHVRSRDSYSLSPGSTRQFMRSPPDFTVNGQFR